MDTHPDPKHVRRTIRAKVKAQAYSLISEVEGKAPEKPIAVSVAMDDISVTVTVARKGEATVSDEKPVGLFFSPLEAAIVNALKAAGGVSMSGKVIAKRCEQKYGATLKMMLVNLRHRRVIRLVRGGKGGEEPGYRLMESESRA